MRNLAIKLLFKLLGNTTSDRYEINYLFGGSTSGHETRKKTWGHALARLWQDKPMMDFLYYQAENDKENVWNGKIDKKAAQGARIRTMFIVYQAQRAYNERVKANLDKRSDPDEIARMDEDSQELGKVYEKTTETG